MNLKTYHKNISYKKVFGIVVIASFITWLIAIIINPESIQRDLFYGRMKDFWADATNTTGYAHNPNPYLDSSKGLMNVQYPPLAYALFYLLARAAGTVSIPYVDYFYNPLWTFLFVMTLIVAITLMYTLIIKKLGGSAKTENVLVGMAICVSYPMLFTVERANIILIAALAVMIFLFYYDSESKIKKEVALISLAFAAGLKLSPALFGILLIYNKDWKAAIRAIIYGLLFFIVPFFFFDGGLEVVKGFLNNFGLNLELEASVRSLGINGIAKFYYGIVVRALTGIYPDTFNENLDTVISVIKYILTAVILISGFFIKENWKKILNISIILIIIPEVSVKYCLLYIIPFIIIFLKDHENCKKSSGEIFILLSSILICFDYRFITTAYVNRPNLGLLILLFMATFYSVCSIISFIKNKKSAKLTA